MPRRNRKKQNVQPASTVYAVAAPEEINSPVDDVPPIAPLLSESSEPVGEVQLELFRAQWQQELLKTTSTSEASIAFDGNPNEEELQPSSSEPKALDFDAPAIPLGDDVEKENTVNDADAYRLFLTAAEHESIGDMTQAVKFYRRAHKMDPDVEKKHKAITLKNIRDTQVSSGNTQGNDVVDPEAEDLIITLRNRIYNREQRFIPLDTVQPCPLNSIPTELIEMIVRYVVTDSVHLDHLVNLSAVCAQFYLISRSQDLWRRIFMRSVCPLVAKKAALEARPSCWMSHYFSTPHIQFNGVYISRTSYLRQGDNCFQDGAMVATSSRYSRRMYYAPETTSDDALDTSDHTYNPFHMVQYFRMARFYPDGTILLLCTSDEPRAIVSSLRKDGNLPNVMRGTYHLDGNTIIAEVTRRDEEFFKKKNKREKKTGKKFLPPPNAYGIVRHTFYIKLSMVGAPRSKLAWVSQFLMVEYSDGGTWNKPANMMTNADQYPPFRFHRINSYMMEHANVDALA